ncbi:MAG: DUF481 domain-containing protein [Cyclobacteriaceae bacterium]
MKRLILMLLLFSLKVSVGQILKVDKGSLLLDTTKVLIGNVGLNFNLNNQSATSEEQIYFVGLKATSDLAYLRNQHAYILITSVNYFKSTGGPLVSTGYAHGRVNFFRMRKLSYENYAQIQYDDGRNMPYRFLIGGGMRLSILESEKSSVHLGIGAMREHENWKNIQADNVIIEKRIWKTSSYLGINTAFNEVISFHLAGYYQGGWDREDEIFRNRTSIDFQFRVKVTDRLGYVISYTGQYEDKPIIPINNFVFTLTNGLMWNF